MGLKDTYKKEILKSSTNVVGYQNPSSYGNAYFDERLCIIGRIINSGLDKIKEKSTLSNPPSVFKVTKSINAFGTVVSIHHAYRGEIQFAIPRDDKEQLLVSILPPYSSYGVEMPIGKIYDYTGNIEAANDRLVEWLAEVAPEQNAEIITIFNQIENLAPGPMITMESSRA